MTTKRAYTAQEIREFVELFRNAPDISPEKFSGMEMIANICKRYERMTDKEIEQEAARAYRGIKS